MIATHAEAAARNQVSRLAGVADQQIGGQSALTTDFIGLLGEVAFSIFFDCERDSDVSVRSGSIDFISNGKAVEVKSSKYPNAHLLVPSYEIGGKTTTKEYCDAYVLMLVDIDARTVTFAGWAERDELINPRTLEYFRNSSRLSFVLPQDALHQLDEYTAGWIVAAAKAKGHNVSLTSDGPVV